MKVVEETRTRLRLQHRPITKWLSGISIFAVCLSFLIYCLFFDAASARLNCDRLSSNQINCELKRFNLLGNAEKLKIFDPQEAYMITRSGSKGGKTYQVVVVTSFGEYALLSHLSYQVNQEVAFQINDFISSQRSSLLVQQNQRNHIFFISLLMLILMTVGVFLATSPVSNCTFYKTLNKVLIERKGLRGQTIIEHPLEQIICIDIQEKQFKYSKLYRSVIIMKFGKNIPINPEYSDENSIRHAVFRINSFLRNSQ
ncbi:hypothetical protein [Halotia branconii]|uniref:Transmembrane protein n=1 Tax=Halotia branconii CENA392 TaxID=1539056 RepID=A0AAJ6PBF9_9CYAN|nr:hypothetical protein [Halotia branconii]WGV27776.1 hypothetical protein QI031_09950 [Halotia branconii CENA392]